MAREKREKEESALNRLEEALMVDSEDDSSTDDSSTSGGDGSNAGGDGEGGKGMKGKPSSSGVNDLFMYSESSFSSSDDDEEIDEETFLQML